MVEDWLLSTYAVAVPGPDDLPDQYTDEVSYLYADRYGSPTGAPHGGSGRVGISGEFNAKGIGQTPLVSTKSDWYHSHGWMFLEEAVREALLSEIAHKIFPFGAVPTLAVIDVGARLRWGDGTFGAQRAIIVRPAFIRIANLMRSIYFGTSGFEGSDQTEDAACVRDAWKQLDPLSWIESTFDRLGQQYGYGNALRLWPGPVFASNVAIDGRIVDFGSFRALPSWKRALGEAQSHGFGAELSLVEAAAKSLQRNGMQQRAYISGAVLTEAFRKGFKNGFISSLDSFGIIPGSRLHQDLINEIKFNAGKITDISGGKENGAIIGSLKPLTWLFRENLVSEIENIICDSGDNSDKCMSLLSSFIDEKIERSTPFYHLNQ